VIITREVDPISSKTAKEMNQYLPGLTVKCVIPGRTPRWILMEFIPDPVKLKELVTQPDAVKRVFLTVWVGEQRKFDPCDPHEWDMALHVVGEEDHRVSMPIYRSWAVQPDAED
jgi:hypothetical protein